MKGRMLVVGLVLLALTGACTPTIYGVPETTWAQMSEPERIAAMEAYRQRQIALQQAQAERARQRAIAQEAERQRQAEEEWRRQQQIDAIYRGQGVYGDLLQVTLSEGMINFSGKHRPYPPLTFRIALGETRDVTVVDAKGRRRDVRVSYHDGSLVLDSRGARSSQVARFSFAPAWEDGISFPPVETKGSAELRGVRVAVTVLGEPPHRRRPRREVATPQPPQVIVVQAPTPPPQIVVVEPPDHRPAREEHRAERRQPEPQPPVVTPPFPRSPVPPPRSEPRQPDWQEPPGRDDQPHRQARREETPPAPPVTSPPPSHRPQGGEHRQATLEAGAPDRATAPADQDRAPQRLRIRFQNGQVKIKGKYYPFTPAEYRLGAGELLRIALQSPGGEVQVTLSYRDGILALDPGAERGSRGQGKHELAAGRGWARGQTYRFDTPGGKLLKQVDLEVVSDHSG